MKISQWVCENFSSYCKKTDVEYSDLSLLNCQKYYIQSLSGEEYAWADPGFFLGGGAPLSNGVADGWGTCKQIWKANMEKASFHSGGGVHPLHRPPRSVPGMTELQ